MFLHEWPFNQIFLVNFVNSNPLEKIIIKQKKKKKMGRLFYF